MNVCILLGGLPINIGETTGIYSKGYTGCIHYLEIYNHIRRIEGKESKQDVYSRSFGGQVDFSNYHLNKNSLGVSSSDLCSLESKQSQNDHTATTVILPLPTSTWKAPQQKFTKRYKQQKNMNANNINAVVIEDGNFLKGQVDKSR